MSLSAALAAITNTPTSKASNVCFTLPISCQICLGKVKEPVVCPNLHAFCSFCIDIWLEKSKQCPTCRVAINKENPCRKILGGIDSKDDSLVPTDFSHSSTRKARLNNLFQQYEDEISRLNKQIDNLTVEISNIKDSRNGTAVAADSAGSRSPQNDMLQMLKSKLNHARSENEEIGRERDKLKEINKKLESENVILLQDLQRLKANLNEKNSQMSSRYTVAAMETKLESYEKEIKQLQRALYKSDKYITDLESQNVQRHSLVSDTHNLASPTKSPTKVSAFSNGEIATHTSKLKPENDDDKLKFIKGDNLTFKNELKVVKFADKINESKDTNEASSKQVSISNDKFYGSPSKNFQNKGLMPGAKIESFNDRLKKNLSFDLEVPSPLSQSLVNKDNVNEKQSSTNYSTLLNGHSERNTDFLFSPMKRLRLEEFQLEKPSFVADETLNNTTMNSTQNYGEANLSTSYNFTTSAANMANMASDFGAAHTTAYNLNASLTPEFNDCLQLLNEAESKIHNRSSPFVSKHSPPTTLNSNFSNAAFNLQANDYMRAPALPDKYIRPSGNLTLNNGSMVSKVAPMSPMTVNHAVSSIDMHSAAANYKQPSFNNMNSINSIMANRTSYMPTSDNLSTTNYTQHQYNSNSVDNLGPLNSASIRSRSVEPAYKK